MKGRNTARESDIHLLLVIGCSRRYPANIQYAAHLLFTWSNVMRSPSRWNHSATYKLNIVIVVDEKG